MDKLMSIEECDRVIANHKSGVQLTQVSLYQQLADCMRDNERMYDALEEIAMEIEELQRWARDMQAGISLGIITPDKTFADRALEGILKLEIPNKDSE